TEPSGARMSMRMAPRAHASISQTGFVKPFGPHHCAMCLVSVQALNTNSLGASKTRVRTRSHCADSVGALMLALCADILLLLLFIFGIVSFQFLKIVIQPVEALFPEA